MSTAKEYEHGKKRSVCDGCEHEHVGCRFECPERAAERWAAIKARGIYYDPKANIGKSRTNYRLFKRGQQG